MAAFDATSYVAWARTLDIVVHDSFGLTAGDSDARAVVAACDVDASPERPAELVFVPFDAMLHARSPLVCNGEREANDARALLSALRLRPATRSRAAARRRPRRRLAPPDSPATR